MVFGLNLLDVNLSTVKVCLGRRKSMLPTRTKSNMSDSFAVLDRDEQLQTETNIKAIPTSQLRPDTLPRSASREIKM